MTLFLTPEGKEKLEKELGELISRRPYLAKRIEVAKELGDLSENAEYHDAKDEQGIVEGRIRELENMVRHAVVVKKSEGNTAVGLGSKIKTEVGGREKTFEIVGTNEAKPMEGKISNESPLGKAFLGRKIGETAEVQTPAGKTSYKIIEIS